MKFTVFLRQTWAGFKVLIVLTVVLGILYPAGVWVVSRVPGLEGKAEGSMVQADGRTVGSSLIGINPIDPNAKKDVTDDRYFHTRPSAVASDFSATDKTKLGLGANDANNSAPSNLAENSPILLAQVLARKDYIAKRDGVSPDQVPADAVTTSASGLDPDISPAYAYLQVDRVARVNGLSQDQVHQIVAQSIVNRPLGVLGDPYVDVMTLNVDVQQALQQRHAG
ncbi:MAG TPA: potassium-transporting ATPase subunit C [Pseudonocardiaceae bacterium]|jgi:K+-transporting ATPase ATPase C chain|nr:potassium-transporting ATPase subunit C [Pseudonocardiaceae bacterium]